MDKALSRRSLLNLGLRSAAGAGILSIVPATELFEHFTGGPALAASAPNVDTARALVCIYLFGDGDAQLAYHPGRGLHPALADLQPLYERKALAVVANVAPATRRARIMQTPGDVMAHRYSALRFLPNGFATPEWAARRADVKPITGEGAYTFASGVSLVAPGSAWLEGEQFENATVRATTSRLGPMRTSFPDTPIGRQLEDVSRLLRAGDALSMKQQVFLAGASGFTTHAQRAGTLAARYRELSQAMAAFYHATVELGLDRQVTTYTDGELATDSNGRESRPASRLVLGRNVAWADVRLA
jgi:uncharacterized protein (DUF1501 family)